MNRYNRQIRVELIGEVGQKKIDNAKVAIIGVGGLGCPVSSYLVGAGVGSVILIEHDTVSETNLHRQVLYSEADIGKLKVDAAYNRLNAQNKNVSITACSEKLSPDNINRLLECVDIIVDASDNFAISYLLSDFAYENKKPLVSASVMKTVGYVGVYCYRSDTQQSSPSLRAVFPNSPEAGQDCNSVGVIGTSAGVIGVLQAQEVLKVILGDKAQLAARLFYIDLWAHRQTIMDFSQAPEPSVIVDIISEKHLTDKDWVIDVRRADEVVLRPKFCDEQVPVSDLDVTSLPSNTRLVFTCASGQRALSVADKAITAGSKNVAVWI